MGMFDAIKRWIDGERKAQPRSVSARSVAVAPRASAPATATSASPAPAPANTAAEVVAPATPAPVVSIVSETAPAVVAALPATPPPPVVPIVRREAERRDKPRVNARDGTRVLIIDDSPTIVALLKRMLEQSGYTALEAGDAETGVALAIAEIPDLIFLDIVLPGMNGFEALRRLRRDPIFKTIPIIMISGNELATEQFYAQRIGADDFMKKPFSRSEVFARIEKLLDADKIPRRQGVAVAASPGA